MRVVMLDAPQALLDERRSKGLDKSDEMWEGELHMVPPPSDRHQAVGSELFLALAPVAKAWYASVGVDEVLVIDPETRRVELFANRDGSMVAVEPVVIECLGVRADTVDGALRLTWDGGSAEI